jgi:very-short-patch-repair endonuclease
MHRSSSMLLDQLRETFAGQPFTVAQLKEQGFDLGRVQRLALRGGLARLHQGVYCAIPAAIDDAVLVEARAFIARHGVAAVMGGAAAADMWGMDRSSDQTVLWVPPDGGLRRGRRGGVVIREGRLPESDCAVIDGVLVTTPLRTGVDLSCGWDQPWQILWALIQGLRREAEWLMSGLALTRLTGSDLAQTLEGHALRSCLIDRLVDIGAVHRGRGIARVRRQLQYADARLESPLEIRSWLEFHRLRLPLPQLQAAVQGDSGRWYRADFRWGSLIGEADGALKYTTAEQLWAEKRRQEDLEQAGFTVVRWSWAQIVHEPREVMARITRALRKAG